MITALILSIFVCLVGGLLAWLIGKFMPGEPKYKEAAMALLGLLVLIIVIALIFPSVGDVLGAHLGKHEGKL